MTSVSNPLRVLLLGAPRIEKSGVVVRVRRMKGMALLAYLCSQRRAVSRDELRALLWPDSSAQRARATLRQTLSLLRRDLGGRGLELNHDLVSLTEGALWVDIDDFEAGAAFQESEQHDLAALKAIARNVDLYSGDFLSGFSLPDSQPFDDWQSAETDRLRLLHEEALKNLAVGFERFGELVEAVRVTQRALKANPMEEAAHRRLMRLLARSGKRSEAIRQYDRCVEIIDEELGVEPEEATTQLVEEIRQGRLAELPVAAPPITQASPPPQPRQSRIAPTRGLPEPGTPFVGRQRELEEIRQRFQEDECRLLTLLGPGGIGKTRLAAQAAREFSRKFSHGSCFVSLAEVESIEGAVAACLDRLGIQPQPRETRAQLLHYVHDKSLFLILDNAESLSGLSELLDEMHRRAPSTKILVTSRRRLYLPNEWLLEIGGLELPERTDDPKAEEYSAVQLFRHSAMRLNAWKPHPQRLEHVLSICRRVGGVPLAIELAASWTRLLGLPEIDRRVAESLDFLASQSRDLPERHRSIRIVFSGSWQLLTESEQTAFRRLSVFLGEFEHEAAAAVAGVSLAQLLQLIDKSLLRPSGGRYAMHELMRHYGRELLDQSPAESAQTASLHAAYFRTRLVHCAESQRQTPSASLQLLSESFEDVRTAWRWTCQEGEWREAADALHALYSLLLASGRFREGGDLFAEAVQLEPPVSTLNMLRTRLASFYLRLGKFEAADELLGQGERHFREHRQPIELAFALRERGLLATNLGDLTAAERFLSEGLEICRGQGEQSDIALCLIRLGRVNAELGRSDEALRSLAQARVLLQRLEDKAGLAKCHINSGVIALLGSDFEPAGKHFREALAILRQLEDRNGIAACLSNLGLIEQQRGRPEEAESYCRQALQLFREMGHPHSIAQGLDNLGRVALAMGLFDQACDSYREALQISLPLGARPAALIALEGLAQILIGQGDSEKALRILFFVRDHSAAPQDLRSQAMATIDRLTRNLGSEQEQKALEESRGMDMDSAAEIALLTLAC